MPKTYKEKVEEITEIVEKICSEWEMEFLESMEEWKGEYTEKQKAVIDRLYQRACESPY